MPCVNSDSSAARDDGFLDLTHPSCFSKPVLFFPLGAAATVTPAWIALFVWLSRYPRRNEPLGAVITDYECLRQFFVAVAVCSNLETQTLLMSSSVLPAEKFIPGK